MTNYQSKKLTNNLESENKSKLKNVLKALIGRFILPVVYLINKRGSEYAEVLK